MVGAIADSGEITDVQEAAASPFGSSAVILGGDLVSDTATRETAGYWLLGPET